MTLPSMLINIAVFVDIVVLNMYRQSTSVIGVTIVYLHDINSAGDHISCTGEATIIEHHMHVRGISLRKRVFIKVASSKKFIYTTEY